ncbi:MAG: DUF3179 domain-containing protein, partial [Planctomycetaceae bacterium]|nr:DUF3179 domain-containing protein [Planctomycetaceae bacterium]
PPPPLDADLPPEREILKEARSDPRNLKPDAFPVIRKPVYLPAAEARKMDPVEWVIGTVIGDTPLAYPVNVLNRHEILLDDRDGIAFMVCWCPLCRTGTVHARTLDGVEYDFGHSGQLYRSAFLLYDTATKSLWHNATGRALAGKLRGRALPAIPSRFLTWDAWRKAYPRTLVLAKNPLDLDQTIDGYDRRNRALKLRFGLGVSTPGEERLYELTQLDQATFVQETVGGVPLAVVYQPSTQTALAWDRRIDGVALDLRRGEDGEDGLPRIEETGEDRSVFHSVTGECLAGRYRGKRLAPAVSCFWEIHAWIAHHPAGTMFRASVQAPPDLPDLPPGDDGGK